MRMISKAVSRNPSSAASFLFLVLGCAEIRSTGDSLAGSADNIAQEEAEPRYDPEIVNGEPSPASENFVVRVHARYSDGYESLCTGSLIHPSVILTAQHCVGRMIAATREGLQNRYFWYRAHSLESITVAFGPIGATTVAVTHVAVPFGTSEERHEVAAVFDEDLAVLWLASPISGVRIANLDGVTRPSITGVDLHDTDARANAYGDSGQFRVAGWGRVDSVHDATQRQSRFSRVAKKDDAASGFSEELRDVESLRADFEANTEQFSVLPGSLCPGDSGGPAFDRTRSQTLNGVTSRSGPWIVGVVSFGAIGNCTSPQD